MALALSACRDRGETVCALVYDRVGGEPSPRRDVLTFDRSRGVLVREIFPEGIQRPRLGAIYYYFNEEGQVILEALDNDANGDIEARLDAQPPVFGVLTPYIVDLDLQDGTTNALQLSLDVPTAPIAGWNPARLFFQLPCDQVPETLTTLEDGREEVTFLRADNQQPLTRMVLQRTDFGAVESWAIDLNLDGRFDEQMTARYAPDQRIIEAWWVRSNELVGRRYNHARWTYDTDGELYGWELDGNGDGVFEHAMRYTAACARLQGRTR
jgi:hypothetical protein